MGLKVLVHSVHSYRNFRTMLTNEKLHCCLPDHATIDGGVKTYLRFPGYQKLERTHGVLAFRITSIDDGPDIVEPKSPPRKRLKLTTTSFHTPTKRNRESEGKVVVDPKIKKQLFGTKAIHDRATFDEKGIKSSRPSKNHRTGVIISAQQNMSIRDARTWTKVHGDGFCWLYAFLVGAGVLTRHDFPNGDAGQHPPSEKAVQLSRALAPHAFRISSHCVPQFVNGRLRTSGTYGGHGHFENLLSRIQPSCRFFVLDETRAWIKCAIICKTNQSQLHSNEHQSRRPQQSRGIEILSLCRRSGNVMRYDYDGPSVSARIKFLFAGDAAVANDDYVVCNDTDVVICWASTNHFNALSAALPPDQAIQKFLSIAVNYPHRIAELYPESDSDSSTGNDDLIILS